MEQAVTITIGAVFPTCRCMLAVLSVVQGYSPNIFACNCNLRFTFLPCCSGWAVSRKLFAASPRKKGNSPHVAAGCPRGRGCRRRCLGIIGAFLAELAVTPQRETSEAKHELGSSAITSSSRCFLTIGFLIDVRTFIRL